MKTFISNESFVKKFLEQHLDEKHLIRYLLVILWIIKTYGRKIHVTKGYEEMIGKSYPEIAKLHLLLHSLGKDTIRNLNEIIKICKKTYVLYKKEFSIHADKTARKSLEKHVLDVFPDADILYNEIDIPGIDIRWEWYHYHRTLQKDLDIVLKD